MLKEIPRGSTFVIRLVEPLKAGFGQFFVFSLFLNPAFKSTGQFLFLFFFSFFIAGPLGSRLIVLFVLQMFLSLVLGLV